MRFMKSILLAAAVFQGGCASLGRWWSSCNAENFGGDWVVVKTDLNGAPYRCWELRDAAVTNESASDGIYWKDRETGNLVHISGLYDRVQVVGGNWDRAYGELGLTEGTCESIHNMKFDAMTRTYTVE